MLTWWLHRPGCGPGLGCSQSCAQGLLTVQGASLSQPAARAPTDQPPGTCSPSARLRAGLQQPQHTRLQRARPDGTYMSGLLESLFDKFQHSFYPVPTLSASSPPCHIWFLLILEDGCRVSGVTVACWHPLQPGWCWQEGLGGTEEGIHILSLWQCCLWSAVFI